MNIDVILQSPVATHKWLSSSEGKHFIEWLTSWQRSAVTDCTKGKDPVEMYRAQGRLEVLNRILGLKDEIRTYQDAVRSGKVQKIS